MGANALHGYSGYPSALSNQVDRDFYLVDIKIPAISAKWFNKVHCSINVYLTDDSTSCCLGMQPSENINKSMFLRWTAGCTQKIQTY